MKVLLLDDPMGNLSRLEERLQKSGIESLRSWDVSDAAKNLLTTDFDGIISSAVCVQGDAITFCLDSKMRSNHPMTVTIYSPYPVHKEDEDFLMSIGIDHVSTPTKEEATVSALKAWESNGRKVAAVPEKYDTGTAMKITKTLHYAAIKDLSAKALKLEEILENSSDVIYELDPYGRIMLISKVIEKLTGYTRDELLGMSALDVVSADSLEVVADHISLLLSGQADPPAVEVGVQCKNGHVIPAEMIVRPIRHSNQVVGILGVGRNVEERKRLEASLHRVINEKDFYLDLMSHDLQNFNTAIIGYLEMIIASEGLDPKIDRYAKGAFRQVMQTAHLIAHLKRVAQIRQFGTSNRNKRDLKEILQRGVTSIQSRPEKNTIAITLEVPEGQCMVNVGDDFNDLLELMITSAARYSMSDLLHLSVSVIPEIQEGHKLWAISISGKSLRLSKPVVQCVMSEDYSGCQMIERPDLQLLVVRAIVETQGGTIQALAQDNGNRGDRFVIRIPQA